MMQLFHETIRTIWNAWEVRVLIITSLLLQIILIILGSRRKLTSSMEVRILVWSAYLIADSVATIALGNLANSQTHCDSKSSEPNNVLQAFWAPFLLLHLGGPDNITAYSLEDNELWLRHLLGLVVQVGVAFYVFLRSWSNSGITFIAIPIFITGIIKYGERTFVLRSSSSENFKDSLLSSPVHDLPEERIIPTSHDIVQAYSLFKRSSYFFANMILDYYGQNDPSYSIIQNKSAEDAFKLVEIELGFMYDVFYTKATIVYSRFGIFLRCVSFLSSLSALIVFAIIIDIHVYVMSDICLTYLLLVTAVFLEVYSFILLLLSDWTKIWLIKLKTSDHSLISKLLSVSEPRKRWSGSMAQYNLVSFCLKDESATCISTLISKLVDIKYRYLTRKDVNVDLQRMICGQLQGVSKNIIENFENYIDQGQSLKEVLDRRGDYVLQKRNSLNEFRWSTTDVDFDHSLLIWHIATDLCYYHDLENTELHEKREIGKCLSDYMLYLLVFCPSMLPKGISHEKRFKDTCDVIKSTLKRNEIFDGRSHLDDQEYFKACDMLLQDAKEEQVVEDQSVLHSGCKLAKKLLEKERIWEIISEVWIEMLTYAANRCAWKEHGQQLRKGGELLTHVSLLMAHLGLSEHYQMKNIYISAADPNVAENLPHQDWPNLL